MTTPGAHLLLLLSSAALLVAGCASGGDQPSGAPPPSAVPTSSSAPSSLAPSTPASTPPASPAPAGPLTVANGTNFKACLKGNCEVIVNANDRIRLDGHLGASSIAIGNIADGQIAMGVALPSGASATMNGGLGEIGVANHLAFTLVATKDGQAVLRLSEK